MSRYANGCTSPDPRECRATHAEQGGVCPCPACHTPELRTLRLFADVPEPPALPRCVRHGVALLAGACPECATGRRA